RIGRRDEGRGGAVGVGEIDVGEGNRAAVGEVAGAVDGDVLGDRAIAVGGDDRGLVGAGDGDGDALGGGAGVVVVDLDRVGLDQGLAGGEEVDGVVGDMEAPGDGAAEAVDGVGDGAGGERAELQAARIGRRDEGRGGAVGVG